MHKGYYAKVFAWWKKNKIEKDGLFKACVLYTPKYMSYCHPENRLVTSASGILLLTWAWVWADSQNLQYVHACKKTFFMICSNASENKVKINFLGAAKKIEDFFVSEKYMKCLLFLRCKSLSAKLTQQHQLETDEHGASTKTVTALSI